MNMIRFRIALLGADVLGSGLWRPALAHNGQVVDATPKPIPGGGNAIKGCQPGRIGVVALVSALLLSLNPWAERSASATLACTKATIQAVAPFDTTIVSATPLSTPVSYCDVRGYVTTTNPGPNQVNFELGLPAVWNGRFLFIGNGGFAGSFNFPDVFYDFIHFEPLITGVSASFATAITDTGHRGSDASWALNNLAKQDDFLFRAVHVTAVAGKALAQAFYGTVGNAYFWGCSTGGRQALLEAQQYPGDFNGIIAGAPGIGGDGIGFNWNEEHLLAAPDNYIPPNKLALVDQAVIRSCDGADGVVDGLIQDPRKCTFDPASLLCAGGDAPNCLTAGQVATFKAIYAGASLADGTQLYPGYTKSDPAGMAFFGPFGWEFWITGSQAPNAPGTAEPWVAPEVPPFQFGGQDQTLKFFVFSNPTYNSLTFNINNPSDLARAAAVGARGGAAATNPDLSAFRNRGGKLLMYHGWSDAALTPLETVQYYKAVVRTLHGGFHRTQQFARLFMVPGMLHCIGSGGSGPNVFDPLPPLISWVEDGEAPDQIIASSYLNNNVFAGVVTRTMPLCPYPKVAVFTGGDLNVASNWICKRHSNRHFLASDDE